MHNLAGRIRSLERRLARNLRCPVCQGVARFVVVCALEDPVEPPNPFMACGATEYTLVATGIPRNPDAPIITEST